MSAEIRILKDPVNDVNVYPLTVGNAVSLEDGSTVQDLANKVIITDQAEYASTLVKSDSSVYVVKKSFSFGGVAISNPLIYRNNEFQITEDWWDAWDNNSYESSYGAVNGSTYFSFIDIGKRFDSRGANFDENSGDIDNANTLNGWRVPTSNELNAIFGTKRPGATVNGVSGMHYVVFYNDENGGPGSDGAPNGVLLFPDNVTIEDDDFTDLSLYKDDYYYSDFTKEDIDYYVNQGCVYMPGTGWYWDSDSWEELNEFIELLSATNEDSGDCWGGYFHVGDGSIEWYSNTQMKSTYVSVFLVKPTDVNPGVYVGDEEVTSGTGGGEIVNPMVLQVAPTLWVKKYTKIGESELDQVKYVLEHPLKDTPESEFVLVRYVKRNIKRYKNDSYYAKFGKGNGYGGGGKFNPKKGWCVAAGGRPQTPYQEKYYFVFNKDGSTTAADLFDYIQNKLIGESQSGSIRNPNHFGIALRIPNPDYTGPSTYQKNAYYKGVYESLWTEPLAISIGDPYGENHHAGYDYGGSFGIGYRN